MNEKSSPEEFRWIVRFMNKDDIVLSSQKFANVLMDIDEFWMMVPLLEPLRIEKGQITKIELEKLEHE